MRTTDGTIETHRTRVPHPLRPDLPDHGRGPVGGDHRPVPPLAVDGPYEGDFRLGGHWLARYDDGSVFTEGRSPPATRHGPSPPPGTRATRARPPSRSWSSRTPTAPALRLVHDGVGSRDYAPGWHTYLELLELDLAGDTEGIAAFDWDARYAGLRARYRSADERQAEKDASTHRSIAPLVSGRLVGTGCSASSRRPARCPPCRRPRRRCARRRPARRVRRGRGGRRATSGRQRAAAGRSTPHRAPA